MDGDKQFAYIISYIRSLLNKCGIADSVSHVLVNGAYSNSRCGKFLKE